MHDVVRAYRQATETPYGLPTYERALSPVLSFTAEGVRESFDVEDQPVVLIRATEPWNGGGLMLLDHTNLPDTFRGVEFDAQVAERFDYWMRELTRGNPLHLWRERFIEARRARHVHGDTAQTITLANTSCELLLDVTLALLMWEQGTGDRRRSRLRRRQGAKAAHLGTGPAFEGELVHRPGSRGRLVHRPVQEEHASSTRDTRPHPPKPIEPSKPPSGSRGS